MPGAWLGTQNGVNQTTFITTGLSAALQSAAFTKMTTVSLVPQNPQPVRRFKACSQDSADDTHDTDLQSGSLGPNSSTGWGKGSQDPVGSAGSPEILPGHIPEPPDPRPGKPLPQPKRNIPGVSRPRTGHSPQGQVHSRCLTSLSQIGHQMSVPYS